MDRKFSDPYWAAVNLLHGCCQFVLERGVGCFLILFPGVLTDGDSQADDINCPF